MCVVIVAAVPTTVIYSIYVATEAARYRCMILTIMCFTFFAGKLFNALNMLLFKDWFKDDVVLIQNKKITIFLLFFQLCLFLLELLCTRLRCRPISMHHIP